MLAATVQGIGVGWLVVASVIIALGSALQATIGIGAGLVAAPILGLIDHSFVPAALVLAILPLAIGMAVRERHAIRMTRIWWAVVGRVPGVIIGSWLAVTGGRRAIAIVVGVTVLVAVAVSLSSLRFVPTRHNLLVAGIASGFGATVAGIGGPPMALTYQHTEPATMRANLAMFFVIGGLMSIVSLAIAGVLGARELWLGVLLMPGVVAGLATAGYTTARLPAERIRPIVLIACAISAIALLVQEFA